MIYIPFPRVDLDTDADLVAWRAKTPKEDGDWKSLRFFLARQPRLPIDLLRDTHNLPKCWYSEMYQGDVNALDVEHFRPKNSGNPLSVDKKNDINKTFAITVTQLQDGAVKPNYNWLEHDYRNYRLVTALPNRGGGGRGGKGIFFPVAEGTNRLVLAHTPWNTAEYPLLLDPADRHDANQLIVLPNGEIRPRASNTLLTPADYANMPTSWHNDGFNYLRACVTIYLYRLDYTIFEDGRREQYADTLRKIEMLLKAQKANSPEFIGHYIQELIKSILPSAQFSLAAKCAILGYVPPAHESDATKNNLKAALDRIIQRTQNSIHSVSISWNNP